VMEKAIREHIKPELVYEVEVVKLNPKKGVAVFSIPRSLNRPHFILEDGRKRAFVRVADRSIQASREMWEILRRGKQSKDMVFTYGDKETILMKALDEHGRVTLREFQRLAKLPRFLASKTLVRLVLANVIQIIPQEKEDYFLSKES
jgi:predicted HTH transcriptional regulator